MRSANPKTSELMDDLAHVWALPNAIENLTPYYKDHVAGGRNKISQAGLAIEYLIPRYREHLAGTGRNRLSAEPWLGGDNRLGRLNLWGGAAWLSGLVATLTLLPE